MSRCRVLEQCERVCKASFGRRTEADCVSIIAYVPRVSASSNIIVDEGLQRTLDL